MLNAFWAKARQLAGLAVPLHQKYDTPVEEATFVVAGSARPSRMTDEDTKRGKQLEAIPHLNRAILAGPEFRSRLRQSRRNLCQSRESDRGIEYQERKQPRFAGPRQQLAGKICRHAHTYHWVVTGDRAT